MSSAAARLEAPAKTRVCVTGGAGYVGSHMVRLLARTGHPVVVVDNLSSGFRDALPADVPLVEADVRDDGAVREALRDHRVEAIFHFASRIQVGESVRDPRLYWRDNVAATVALLESALETGVQHFVFSSSAAVYGAPARESLDEDHPTAPTNPYGTTKLAIEQMLAAYAAAYPFRYVALRYFNASGGEPGLAERHQPETHLLPLAIDAAFGQGPPLTVFGSDYGTPDGSCVRDYVHVSDLAEAHLAGLAYLQRGGASGAFNLGSGVGHSVREVVEAVERVTGRTVPLALGPRRPGDPPVLVADVDRAARVLGWRPRRSALEAIVRDAVATRAERT